MRLYPAGRRLSFDAPFQLAVVARLPDCQIASEFLSALPLGDWSSSSPVAHAALSTKLTVSDRYPLAISNLGHQRPVPIDKATPYLRIGTGLYRKEVLGWTARHGSARHGHGRHGRHGRHHFRGRSACLSNPFVLPSRRLPSFQCRAHLILRPFRGWSSMPHHQLPPGKQAPLRLGKGGWMKYFTG